VYVSRLRITDTASDSRLAAARWALFVFPEIREVCRIVGSDEVAVLHNGASELRVWLEALEAAGFAAAPAAPQAAREAA
jgi:hypothetical protein